MKSLPVVETLSIPLDRDPFMRTLLRELSGTLQEVVGLDDSKGFISVVGRRMGEGINEMYREALGTDRIPPDRISDVLVDLKRRIEGDFFVEEENENRIVLGNRACPFGEKVLDRPSLCMMTSNVFGVIVADNLGYGRVVIEKAIAFGDEGCRIVVHLRPPTGGVEPEGREYFGADNDAE